MALPHPNAKCNTLPRNEKHLPNPVKWRRRPGDSLLQNRASTPQEQAMKSEVRKHPIKA